MKSYIQDITATILGSECSLFYANCCCMCKKMSFVNSMGFGKNRHSLKVMFVFLFLLPTAPAKLIDCRCVIPYASAVSSQIQAWWKASHSCILDDKTEILHSIVVMYIAGEQHSCLQTVKCFHLAHQ